MDSQSSELIEKEMQLTRESLTEKVSLLEQQVVDQFQSTTGAVQETVDSVKTAVQDTVESVTGTLKDSVTSITEGVKKALDVTGRVREHPWPMVGGAAVAGLVTGLIALRRHDRPAAIEAASQRPAFLPAQPAMARRSGWLDELLEMAGREVRKLAEQALTTATSSIKQSMSDGLPKLIENAMQRATGPSTHEKNGFDFAKR